MPLGLKGRYAAARASAHDDHGIFERMTWDPVAEHLVKEFVQDVEPVLESNAGMRRDAAEGNNGYSPSGDLRRVASIPTSLLDKWRVEEGIDYTTKEGWKKVLSKLDDPDYAFLRTAPGRVGAHPVNKVYSIPSSETGLIVPGEG